ncbi:membrane hypothetical protein [Paraburkholderia sacchari]
MRPIAGSGIATTLVLCFAVALLEGLDLQSVGVAAPRMAREFGLSVSQMGLAFSAGTFGLLPGALFGGRLADRIGRKRVLILSAIIFAVLSLAAALVSSFGALVLVRALTGVGLGGALPNLIALSSEAVSPKARNTAVSVMYCGIPFGGLIASLIGIFSAAANFFDGVAPTPLINAADKDARTQVSAYAQYSGAKIGAGWMGRRVVTDSTATPNVRSNLFFVGASYTVTPAFIVDGEVFRIINSDHDTRAMMGTLRTTYFLSKRSSVYAQAAYLANSEKARYSVSGGGGGTTPGAGMGQTGVMVGLKHMF